VAARPAEEDLEGDVKFSVKMDVVIEAKDAPDVMRKVEWYWRELASAYYTENTDLVPNIFESGARVDIRQVERREP